MKEGVLRYDTIYSRNELVVLFCGTEITACSLDERITKLNAGFKRGHFNGNPLKPEIMEIASDIGEVAENGIVINKVVRIYSLNLDEVLRDRMQLAHDVFTSEINRHARINRSKIDGHNNLPIIVEAPNLQEAEGRVSQVRDQLMTSYTNNPQLREPEIRYYLKALLYLASPQIPPTIFIFDRGDKLISK